jgi:hypothetical protein
MTEAFSRLIEAHASSRSLFHQPVCSDAQIALRELRGIIPFMKSQLERKPLTVERARELALKAAPPGSEVSRKQLINLIRLTEQEHGIN